MIRLLAALLIIAVVWLAAEYWSPTVAIVVLASMAAFGLYGLEERLARLEQFSRDKQE